MVEIPKAAQDHYEAMQSLQVVVLAAGRRAWRQVDPRFLSRSWSESLTDLMPVVTSAQVRAATSGSSYGAATLAQQGSWVAPDAFVDPQAFGGYASDGRSLEGLLLSPVVSAKSALKRHPVYDDESGLFSGWSAPVPMAQALARGQSSLDTILRTTIADAARQAAGADTTSRRGVGYIRMLNPPSCIRCAVLAGRFYRWNSGFQRHPKCFPAGVAVSGPSSEAATRRWFEGELVVLTTASGQELPLTGNHPVLTTRGWVPANLLEEGDYVVRSTRPEGATPLVVPDHQQVPALVEDVWRSLGMDGLERVPSSAEDFHGDGQDGEVDVVYADGALRDRGDSSLGQHLAEQGLAGGVVEASALYPESVSGLLDLWDSAGSGRTVGSGGLPLAVFRGGLLVPDHAGFAHGSSLHTCVNESLGDDPSRDAVLLGERVFAGSGQVGGHDLLGRDEALTSRWDAPGLAFGVETADGYASRGRDLLERLSGQVELDRVVKLVRSEFAGHVYSLTSSEGWHVANSLIVSNCDCVHVQSRVGSTEAAKSEGLIEDPMEYFNSLSSSEQDKLFGVANSQAIRDGADMSRVSNAYRGKSGLTTTEGTTRRGFASNMRGQRLTPEGIYKTAGSREEALRLLEQHGYTYPGGKSPKPLEGYGALGRGGQRVGARSVVDEARRTGVRDGSRYTMTAAERRVVDSEQRYLAVLQGRNPYTRTGSGLTPTISAQVETDYRRWLASGGQIFTT